MARYLDENGLALLINNYLKPEDEYSLSSEHPVQNKVLTQTFGNLLSIIDYSKVTGYFHYANAAALPTVNSTGQEEGDFEYNPEKELKVGQRAILDDTQAVMEISAIDSETGAITWTDTGLSFGGQVIQVDELPTASAAEEDKIYQYVGDTDALTGVINGYFYKCVSDGAVSPSYSWENIKVSEGDTIQVETLPTAGASEVGNIYQYVGETNLSFTNGYFYECVEDSGSYNWVEKEVQKNEDVPHWSGTRAEYEAQKDSIPEGAYVALTDDIDSTYESGDYSLNEVNTGKRWIDGKPIYRKVFTDVPFPEEADIVQSNAATAARTTVAFPANYISDIVSASFVAIRRDDGSQQHSLPRRWNSGDPETGDNIIIVIDASIYSLGENMVYNFEVRSNRTSCNNTTFKARAIIEYTKND